MIKKIYQCITLTFDLRKKISYTPDVEPLTDAEKLELSYFNEFIDGKITHQELLKKIFPTKDYQDFQTGTEKARDYKINPAEALGLQYLVIMPNEDRLKSIKAILDVKGDDYLIDLFSQFIGMANSVIHNNREMIEMYLITEGMQYPHDAEKINLPTMLGALNGIRLTPGIKTDKVCKGCAFKQGTCANQSISTTIDAHDQVNNNAEFMCHMDGDKAVYTPTQRCRGWAQAVAAHKDDQS